MTTDSTGAELDPKGDGESGVAPPAKSQGEKPPGDWVPKTQFIAALNSATAKTDALEREVRELRAAQEKAKEPKPPTLAELRRLVEAAELTQDQADAIWEKQVKADVERNVIAKVTETTGAHERATKVKAEMAGYREVVGEAWVEGTPERLKAEKEYRHLVELGHPTTEATEVAALRAAFGDLETLRASKAAKPGSEETHSETGGGKPEVGKGADVVKGLTPREKAHYEKLIGRGVYKDWDAVKAERAGYAGRRSR